MKMAKLTISFLEIFALTKHNYNTKYAKKKKGNPHTATQILSTKTNIAANSTGIRSLMRT